MLWDKGCPQPSPTYLAMQLALVRETTIQNFPDHSWTSRPMTKTVTFVYVRNCQALDMQISHSTLRFLKTFQIKNSSLPAALYSPRINLHLLLALRSPYFMNDGFGRITGQICWKHLTWTSKTRDNVATMQFTRVLLFQWIRKVTHSQEIQKKNSDVLENVYWCWQDFLSRSCF